MKYTVSMFAEKDRVLADLQTRRTLLMMDGKFPAAQLYAEIMKVVKFLSNIPKGAPGKTPVKGTDYFTEQEIKTFSDAIFARMQQPANGITPKAGVDYPNRAQIETMVRDVAATIKIPVPADGHTPQRGVDYWTSADIDIMANQLLDRLSSGALRDKLLALTNDDRLDASAIKNIPTQVVRTELPAISLFGNRPSAGGKIQVLVNGVNIGQDIKRVNFVGTGVTAQREGDGNAAVTIVGSGGGVNISTEAVTAVTSGNDVTIDLTQLAHTLVGLQFISRNGQIQPPVASSPADGSSGYNISGSAATVYNAASGETFLICYTY